MMSDILFNQYNLVHTYCPIDGSDDADVEVYPSTLDFEKISADLFSARRTPDNIHYRMVKNTRTGCLRADPILVESLTYLLYRASRLAYEDLKESTINTYLDYARPLWRLLRDYRGVLEIGCGAGYFLEQMQERGFDRVCGVEPCIDAAEKANCAVRSCIYQGVLTDQIYDRESFSLVCGFQVLDHLSDPNKMLKVCADILIPGGVMYWICHDAGAWTARLLGHRSPIIDIEHVVLYDKRTIAELFKKNGFFIHSVFGVANTYPLTYWTILAPLPEKLKRVLLSFLEASRLGRWRVRASLGNLGIIAIKP